MRDPEKLLYCKTQDGRVTVLGWKGKTLQNHIVNKGHELGDIMPNADAVYDLFIDGFYVWDGTPTGDDNDETWNGIHLPADQNDFKEFGLWNF